MAASISVVVTTFNQAAYIESTLESVLGQSLPPSEVIVVDDGSTDETPRVLERFSGHVKVIRQANQGVAGSRNTGVAAARGELVALLDGDDLWHPDKLAAQWEAWKAHPDTGLIATRCLQFVDTPDEVNSEEFQRPSLHGHLLSELIRQNQIATTSSVAIPRGVLEAVGPSDARYAICSDYDLYLRIAARWPITIIGRPLTFWRYRPQSVSGPQAARELRWAPEIALILDQAARMLPGADADLARRSARDVVDRMSMRAYDYSEVDRRVAIRTLRGLIRTCPASRIAWLALAGSIAPTWCRRAARWLTNRVGLGWRQARSG